MTREEAIKIINCYDINFYDLSGEKIPAHKLAEAYDMAIEALTQDSRKVTQESTQDLISRTDALKPFCIAPDGTRIPEVDCDNFPVEFSVEFIKKHLLSLPSAEPKTGEWIDRSDGGRIKYPWWESCKCNQCGEYGSGAYDFCPNCGARMKGADDDD